MTDQELIKLNLAVYQSVVIDDCYSVEDCRVLAETEGALLERGYVWDEENRGWIK